MTDYNPMYDRARAAEYLSIKPKTLDAYRNPKNKLFKNFPHPDSVVTGRPLWQLSTINRWKETYLLSKSKVSI